ncbi:hypothetical protein C2E23DRAFT_545607 [Lenzites betulinus]|nr:hypothetical protein C2E23DRAFT_545607 [Lenzites betulinus]
MEFLRWENDGHSGEPGWHSTPVVFPNNVNVTLDTGTSVSRLPRFIGEAITRHYRCPGQYDGRILGRAPYVLPRGFNTKEDKVVLHFRGFGREDIAITSQAEHFLYAESPRQRGLYEGLIFEETAAASPILGLNWFHVNWVAMHKPKYNAPYVRVAAQDSDLANDYLLPPMLKL